MASRKKGMGETGGDSHLHVLEVLVQREKFAELGSNYLA